MCRRLRLLRERQGYTQQEVADKLEVSQAAYSRLEKGEVELSFRKLVKLSEIYDVTVAKLLEGV